MSRDGPREFFAALLPDLQQAVQTAGDPATAAEDGLAAVGVCGEILAELWPSLAASGPHLTEFLAFLDTLVTALPDQAARGDEEGAVRVLELLALLEAHLETPRDEEIVAALLELAMADVFEVPLSVEVADLWLQRGEPAETVGPEDAPGESEDTASDAVTRVRVAPVAAPAGEHAPGVARLSPADEDAASEPETRVAADSREEEARECGPEVAELLGLLSAAIEENRDDFLTRAEEIAGAPDAPERTRAVRACQDLLERFAQASAQAGFVGFSGLCSGLGSRMLARPGAADWPASLIDGLVQLPWRMQAYLECPFGAGARRELVEILLDDQWQDPLSAADAEALVGQLRQDLLALESETVAVCQATVADADLSLAPSDDIDPSVLASFRREGPELTHRLAEVVQAVLAGRGGDESLRLAQRLAHTIKGSANICGVQAIAVLSHHLEDLLELLTTRGLAPSPSLGAALAAGADGLALMFDMLDGVEARDPRALRSIVQQVLDWSNRIHTDGAAALTWEREESARLDAPPEEPAVAPPSAVQPPEPAEPETAYLQIPAQTVDDLLRLVGELSIALSQAEEQLAQTRRVLRESGEVEQRNLTQVAELEELVDLRALGLQPSAGTATVGQSAFDALELEQYNQMYTAVRRLDEGVQDAREFGRALDGRLHALDEAIQHQARLGRLIRQLAMGVRLIQVDSLVPRLQRAVRQSCRATGKDARLQVLGEHVLIDGEVLDRLAPALMHLVRNAIDHGIEPPEQRETLGKSPCGQLEIRFEPVGDQIMVTCDDDGRGLDLERIRAKAIAAGMLPASAEPTDQELMLLTLRPGFSTRDRVTQISGRGVGMDVVASIVRALNGTLTLDSRPGAGCRLQMRLPASRLTLYCLLLRYGDQVLAIPANETRLTVLADEGELEETRDGRWFAHGGRRYPLHLLDRLLGLRTEAPDPRTRVVLIVTAEEGEQAVLADALLDGRELVIMPPGDMVPRIPGLIALSLLGDGTVVPILQMRTILQLAREGHVTDQTTAEQAASHPPTVLIVDDSVSLRRVLARLVADGGYRPLTACDGMDALQVMARERVDLLLVDMEMPQMNGLELAAHVRAQPDWRALPIGMITSRSSDKHRREALRAGVDRYFVKPYREDEVMDFLQQAFEQVS